MNYIYDLFLEPQSYFILFYVGHSQFPSSLCAFSVSIQIGIWIDFLYIIILWNLLRFRIVCIVVAYSETQNIRHQREQREQRERGFITFLCQIIYYTLQIRSLSQSRRTFRLYYFDLLEQKVLLYYSSVYNSICFF